jgi:PAS domain S-box-containing protein
VTALEDAAAKTGRPDLPAPASEDVFSLLVQSVDDYAIFVLDPEGRVASWNAGAQRLKGYRAEEIVGEHFSKFYPAEDAAAGKPAAELEAALRDGRAYDQGWRVRKDGTLFWADVVVTAMHDETGRFRGFAKVTRDLTERKRAEEDRLRLARAEAELRLRDEFLMIASHELRTPLGALRFNLASLDLLRKREQSGDSRLERAIETAKNQVRRLSTLVDRLLDVSRISTGRLTLVFEPVEVVALVRQVAADFHASAVHEGSTIDLVLPEGPVQARWDALRIEQTLGNLLSNAIKYGRGNPIRIELAADDVLARITIADAGIGIAPDVIERIFERFERAVAARDYAGLGLGLYIARHLVAAHDGRIEVESEPGRGTTFVLEIPLAGPARTERSEEA